MFLSNILLLTIAITAITNHNSFANKVYDFQDKIVLITGGSRGIGFSMATELLSNGIKGITLVNVNIENGQKAAKELNKKFGHGKAIFIPADVRNSEQLENAYKISYTYWKGLDIVINNAGIADEVNWKKMIDVNIVGVLQSTFLGFKYMSKGRGGQGGVIINTASFLGIDPFSFIPIYSASKHFVIGLGRALGDKTYYDYNQIRVLTLCPGFTQTDIVESAINSLSNRFHPNTTELLMEIVPTIYFQSPENVAKALIEIVEEGSNGSVWVAEDDQPAYEIEFPDRKSMKKKN